MPLYAPFEPASLAAEAMDNLSASGLGNPVAGVLFVYRAFDTLLEKGRAAACADRRLVAGAGQVLGRRAGTAPVWPAGSVLVLLARTLPPFGIMFALYMTWIGADEPGGAFQGGTGLGGHVDPRDDDGRVGGAGVSSRCACDDAARRAALLPGDRFAGFFLADAFLDYPDGSCETLDHRGRICADAFDRRCPWPACGRSPGQGAAGMNAITLYWICGSALVGFGLYGLIVNPQPLAKILALNLLGFGRVPAVRRHCPARGRGRPWRRSGAAGAGHHRHRRGLFRHGDRGGACCCAFSR